jgi:hypothetical protein
MRTDYSNKEGRDAQRTTRIRRRFHGEEKMTHAENEIIEMFCRELALALRRITGRTVEVNPETLLSQVKDAGQKDDTPLPKESPGAGQDGQK